MTCLLPYRWDHKLGWPVCGAETCIECGRSFESILDARATNQISSTEGASVGSVDLRQPHSIAWPLEGSDVI